VRVAQSNSKEALVSLPRLRWPSPALLVSIIALVIACAGTATAATVLIRSSKQVAKGSINSSDLANGKGVKVADLTPAARSALKGKAGPTGLTGPVGLTGPAGPKGDTGGPGSPTLPPPEAFHEVGSVGQPAFENGWVNYGPTLYETTAFYKDPLGVVHLKGTVENGNTTIFTLPVGYRPAKSQFFPTVASNAFGDVLVRGLTEGGAAGQVHFNAGNPSLFVSLSGISFRAAG
jgi:hypothetical protein